MDAAEFRVRIAEVYRIAGEIGSAFRIDNCTPDGHLVGAFGQIAAKLAFGLEFGASTNEHNCTWAGGGKKTDIQVRCTGAGSILLRSEPVYLIALEVSPTGLFTLLYNGPGRRVWQRIQHQKSTQKTISKQALLELHRMVPQEERLPVVLEGIF
uniref:DUF6998 domain-containing protein n=1 Tax=Geobacter sp. (strain M21) TaxID=443144 RepID=C6DZE8_GEOSM